MKAAAQKSESKGLENLEFLADKAKRLIFQLENEEKGLRDLRKELNELRARRKEIVETNRGLKEKLASLQNDREKVDEKIDKILNAIGDLPLE